jgi:putative hydrolase of the HAD superfamily
VLKPSKAPDLSRVRAFFFDAGGTLFQPYPSVGEIYAEVARPFGLVAEPHALERVFHTAWEERDGLASLSGHSGEKEEKQWWRTLVWDVFGEFGKIKDFDGFFERLYDRFASAETWHLFPDTIPTLQRLKRQGKTLGIISNWDSRLFGLCKGLGLEPYLDFILASAVVGAAKPSPKIFQEALRRSGFSAETALHVGDSLEDDILGAQRVGILAVFLDRKGRRPAAEVPTIADLDTLCKWAE